MKIYTSKAQTKFPYIVIRWYKPTKWPLVAFDDCTGSTRTFCKRILEIYLGPLYIRIGFKEQTIKNPSIGIPLFTYPKELI